MNPLDLVPKAIKVVVERLSLYLHRREVDAHPKRGREDGLEHPTHVGEGRDEVAFVGLELLEGHDDALRLGEVADGRQGVHATLERLLARQAPQAAARVDEDAAAAQLVRVLEGPLEELDRTQRERRVGIAEAIGVAKGLGRADRHALAALLHLPPHGAQAAGGRPGVRVVEPAVERLGTSKVNALDSKLGH